MPEYNDRIESLHTRINCDKLQIQNRQVDASILQNQNLKKINSNIFTGVNTRIYKSNNLQ